MTAYRPPSWACPAPEQFEWSVTEIKGGVELAKHALRGACTVFGRAADAVQIATNHESCSRQHARIAFDRNGLPWLRDLASTHGTTVNKRKLPRQAVGKIESNSLEKGSRGVILYPGDAIQFGASTRMYLLDGPPEYERGASRTPLIKQHKANSPIHASAAATATAQLGEDASGRGVSWGLDMDDENGTDASEDHAEGENSISLKPLDPAEIPERHQKAFEKITAKRYKLANLQKESERIRRKGSADELTAGQNQQLLKNSEKETVLERELEEMERDLRQKINPNANLGAKKGSQADEYVAREEEDVDDFYDRTIDHNTHKHSEQESEQSLTTEWRQLYSSLRQHVAEACHAHERVNKVKRRLAALQDGDDDIFFVQNELDLAMDESKKADVHKRSILAEMDETERLLRIVNEKITFDRENGCIGEASTIMPHPLTGAEHVDMPPPPALQQGVPDSHDRKGISMAPPPKRKRMVGPPEAEPTTNSSPSKKTFTAMPPPSLVTKKVKGPHLPQGTLSAIMSANRVDHGENRKEGKEIKNAPTNTNGASKTASDPKEDVWRAPEGQDGSGMTKLNSKFAGRY